MTDTASGEMTTGDRPAEIAAGQQRIEIIVGEKLFQFRDKQDWIDKSPEIWSRHNVSSRTGLCVDAKGRICEMGMDFTRAEKDSAYPVTVYRTQIDR